MPDKPPENREEDRRAKRAQAIGMIWAREAGVSVYIYEGEHSQRIIEIRGIVDQREAVLATATIQKRHRDEFAEILRSPEGLDEHGAAYNQGIEDAKAAIRAVGTDDWEGDQFRPYFINEIARTCSPHRYQSRLASQVAAEKDALKKENSLLNGCVKNYLRIIEEQQQRILDLRANHAAEIARLKQPTVSTMIGYEAALREVQSCDKCDLCKDHLPVEAPVGGKG